MAAKREAWLVASTAHAFLQHLTDELYLDQIENRSFVGAAPCGRPQGAALTKLRLSF